MPKTTLLEIDLKVLDKSVNDCIGALDELEKAFEDECKRLTYHAGMIIVRDAKHREGDRQHRTKNTGSLLRSIHCAPGDAGHAGDQKLAEAGKDLDGAHGTEATRKGLTFFLQIGSWLDYAYYVCRGTKNMDAFPYLFPAMESKFQETVDYIANGLRIILESRGK